MKGLFPYSPRPQQQKILDEVGKVASSGGTLLLDAPTGSGKTISTLAPLLEHSVPARHTILYLVRTHAQATQVMREVSAIKKYSGEKLVAVSLEGRSGRCPLMDGWESISGATPEEYGKLCSDRKRSTEHQAAGAHRKMAKFSDGGTISVVDIDGCNYYAKLLADGTGESLDYLRADTPTGAEFTGWSRENGLCPYELTKALCRESNVVVAPYITFFEPAIRQALLGWIGKPIDEIDIVIDEAHNLPDYLRELGSSHLSEETVSRAIREVEAAGGLELDGGVKATTLLSSVRATIANLADSLPEGDEGLIPEGGLEERLLEGPFPTTQRLREGFVTLSVWGEALKDARRKQKMLPRSYAGIVAAFMIGLLNAGPPEHLKVVTRSPTRSLILYAMDATAAAKPSTEAHVCVHMSGTLAPLDEHRDSLGLGDSTRMFLAPSAFPPENRKLFISGRATTRHADLERDGGLEALRDEIVHAVKALPVKTAVFFPSFALMDRCLKLHLREGLQKIGRKTVVESQGLNTEGLHELVSVFKRSTEANVLLGVCGGRISEGTDFPNEELGAVILAGIPYPRPTARRDALSQYLDVTIGNGWEHCYAAPARRAMLQALGRMIRSETDKGIGVILDLRAQRFVPWLGKLEPVEDLAECAKNFFSLPASPVLSKP